jgi:outer membrane protein
MKKTSLTLIVLALLLSSVGLFAQTKGASSAIIGIVDVDAVVKEMPEYSSADKEMSEITKKYQDSVMAKRTDIETRYQAYQKQKGMMAADKQQQEEEKFIKESQDLQAYGNEKTQEVNQLREKLLEPIRNKVKTAIEAIAKDEKLTMVLSKESALVLYYEPKNDITFRVIDRIKRGN